MMQHGSLPVKINVEGRVLNPPLHSRFVIAGGSADEAIQKAWIATPHTAARGGMSKGHIMIKTQTIKEDRKPVAVILDYKEYVRLKEIEEDKTDYFSALDVKRENKKWTSHKV